MNDTLKYIKKIKLSDGSIYYIYDQGAPRSEDLNNYLPKTGGTITGNLTVDSALKAGTLQVTSIEYIPSDTSYDVLVMDANGNVKKKSTDTLLADIGGCSYSMDDSTGILSFKIGKQ